ncbi:MAG TPA: phage baseplate assembly protein V [Kofleriaceae bacterium]|nr:phage baseplate assembly protein V [Kofleriaceae bacterium]
MPLDPDLLSGLLRPLSPASRKVYGVVVATVVNNLDSTMEGRVQIHLPWAPGLDPWARVASPMAGLAHGAYFMPQIGQEVLVAFEGGDAGAPYVIGALWNTVDRPPILAPTEAVTRRVMRTPLGHQIDFDDATQTLTITSTTQQTITLDPARIELSAGLGVASVQVTTAGTVTITASASIELNAPSITINGATAVTIQGGTSATLNGGALCAVQGALVKIN